MNDDNDNINENEFEEDLDLGGESFDSFDNKKGLSSLKAKLNDKPLFKVGIIAFVFIAIVAIFMFMRDDPPDVISTVAEKSDITAPPGTGEVSPAIRDAIEEADEQRREEAERTSGSALPTLVEPPVGRIELPADENADEDPLQRWRRLQQERIDREAERSRLMQPETMPDESISPEQIKAMADAMSSQMDVILQGQRKQMLVSQMTITPADYLETLYPDTTEADAAAAAAAAAQAKIDEIILPAGQIVYAQLITEANSDVPGPVLAEIMTGPLKGSRVLGSFKVEDELLSLQFNTIVRDGISSSIDAVALDPATTLPAMATEVDHRYLKRIVLPAAAAFIEGTAEAVAESGTTTITISGDSTSSTTSNEDTDSGQEVSAGIEDAAEEISDLLDEEADRTKILVKIHSGTPMGLLFLQPVLKN